MPLNLLKLVCFYLEFTNVWLPAVEQPSFGSFPRAAVALNFIPFLCSFTLKFRKTVRRMCKETILLSSWSVGRLNFVFIPITVELSKLTLSVRVNGLNVNILPY